MSEEQVESFQPRVIPKTDEEKNCIINAVRGNMLFATLDNDHLKIVVDAMEKKIYKKGDIIIKQGDDGEEFYLVDSGICETYITDINTNTTKMVRIYNKYEGFGELALMYNSPRAATIIASSDQVVLWSVDRNTFRNIVMVSTKEKLDRYENFLSRVPILDALSQYERSNVAYALKEATFQEGDMIIKAGDSNDKTFYILLEGTAEALKLLRSTDTKLTRVFEYTNPGDYFGELSLLSSEPRAASVRATSTPCRVVYLDRDCFERILGPVVDILKRRRSMYDEAENIIRSSFEQS